MRSSSNLLNASFFWPGLIQADIALSVRLDPERSNRGDWIRTSDLPVPNRTLYQAEPRPDITRPPFQPPCTRFLGPEPSHILLNIAQISLSLPSEPNVTLTVRTAR